MNDLGYRRAAVFGATGATGREITGELLRRGVAVRAVSRSPENLERDFGRLDVDRHAADLLDRGATIEAARGCDLIFHCVGLPLHAFHLHPEMASNTGAAMRAVGAQGVLVTSFWSYGAVGSTAVSEEQAPVEGCRKCEQRREQEKVMLAAGGAVAILPDFFGPGADASPLNDALAAAAAGQAALWPGDPDAPRDFIYVPDTGRVLCDLAWRPQAFGGRWNVPGSGAVPPRSVIDRAAASGVAKIRRGRRWMLSLGGIFNRELREFTDVFPLYDQPYGLDGSRLSGLLDDGRDRTGYEEAVPATVEWMSSRESPRRE